MNDRTGWPPGPWDIEPDRAEWRTAAGLPALAVRNGGHWCGYVAVTREHSDYGQGKEDTVECHGRVTYAGRCQGKICHVPAPGEPEDVWWIGFDFAHVDDAYPRSIEMPDYVWLNENGNYVQYADHGRLKMGVYRSLAFVKAECERVAERLAARMGAP